MQKLEIMNNKPLNIDAILENADWTKQTWDLPPIDSQEFKDLLKSWGITMDEFKKLPAYKLSRKP